MTRKLIMAAAVAAAVSMVGGVSATAASAATTKPISHSAFSRGGAILSGPKVAPHAVHPRSRIHTNGTSGSLPASVDLSQYDMPVVKYRV